jgi:pimeloyl-ACP methyl ester carboxylesterase
MEKIKIPEGQIRYSFINKNLLSEDKPLLLFLHEGLGSIPQWKEFPGLLSDELKLPAMIYDRFCYGGSDFLPENFKKGLMHKEAAERLPELLNALSINNQLIITGHSDGATIALLYASFFPEKVNAVVSIAAHCFLEGISIEGLENLKVKKDDPGFIDSLSKYHGENTKALLNGWIDMWLLNEVKNWNMFDELKKIKCPVLAMQGRKDEYGTPEQVEKIFENIPGVCETFIFKDMAHSPHIQNPFEVKNLIKEFLA